MAKIAKLRCMFTEIGDVNVEVVSDGIEEYPSEYIMLDELTKLSHVNGNFYIDKVHSLAKLTPLLAEKFNLSKFFSFAEEIESKPPRRTRKSIK